MKTDNMQARLCAERTLLLKLNHTSVVGISKQNEEYGGAGWGFA
ncbi:hypothetical protein [Ensifer sp. B1-9]